MIEIYGQLSMHQKNTMNHYCIMAELVSITWDSVRVGMVTIFPVISGVHTTSRGLPEYARDTRIDDGTEKGFISPFKIKSTSPLDHTTRKAKHSIVELKRYSLGAL